MMNRGSDLRKLSAYLVKLAIWLFPHQPATSDMRYNKIDMNKYYEISVISHETALTAVSAAIAEGQKQGVAVSVAVVDLNMQLVAFVKADGATPHSVETSRRKANTAASTKKKTGWMDDKLALALPAAANNQLTNVPGGFPIKFEGKIVGGLGIAGGTVEQDAAIAQAVITAIGADTE